MQKILVVEDDLKIARFIELELNHEGFTVETANDGRTGLDKALEGEFDLIVLDIMLPGLNGMDLVNYDLMDRHSFLGRLGMEFSRDNVAVDLGYSYQKGSTHEANRFMVSCNIAF